VNIYLAWRILIRSWRQETRLWPVPLPPGVAVIYRLKTLAHRFSRYLGPSWQFELPEECIKASSLQRPEKYYAQKYLVARSTWRPEFAPVVGITALRVRFFTFRCDNEGLWRRNQKAQYGPFLLEWLKAGIRIVKEARRSVLTVGVNSTLYVWQLNVNLCSCAS